MTVTAEQRGGLLAGLSTAIEAQTPQYAGCRLSALPDTGLAHLHVALDGTGLLARIPKQSQMRLSVGDNLVHQAACFARASASGHTPTLHAVLDPAPGLPRGALLVDRIEGRPALLPGDLPAVVRALARIHAIPLPAAEGRAPLPDAADPLADLVREITEQAAHLDDAGLDPAVRTTIDDGIRRLTSLVPRTGRPAKHLISFDAHPGNFLVRDDGSAVLVDLEKCRYSYPALDLAHATLYTSTTWEAGSSAELTVAEVRAAYATWTADFVAAGGAETDAAWHLPLRAAMQLWSLTWCAKWRVLSSAVADAEVGGEDWAAELSDDALTAHVRGRVDHYLDPVTVARLTAELDALEETGP